MNEDDIDRQARELEDLLHVAKDRNSRAESPARTAPQSSPARQAPHTPSSLPPQPRASGSKTEGPLVRGPEPEADEFERQNEQALVLVRAMVNAAKADGEISQAEQQSILSRLNNPSPEAIQFLREEFKKPLDVREFAWSVPVGMEQQVYTMSLIAIDLDTSHEKTYLRDLAHGLRIPQEVCEQIHERMGAAGPRLAAVR
jgi:uncharacterized membrane protein YebE (DUF533 family)